MNDDMQGGKASNSQTPQTNNPATGPGGDVAPPPAAPAEPAPSAEPMQPMGQQDASSQEGYSGLSNQPQDTPGDQSADSQLPGAQDKSSFMGDVTQTQPDDSSVPSTPPDSTSGGAEATPDQNYNPPAGTEGPNRPSHDNMYAPHQEKKPNLWLPIILLILIAIGAGAYFLLRNNAQPSEENNTGYFEEETTEVSTSTESSDDETRIANLTSLQEALEKYYSANKKYPISASVTKTSDSSSPLQELVSDYISELPTDPADGEYYYGYQSEDGTTYELTAVFDEKPSSVNNTQIDKGYLVTLTPGVVFETSGTTESSLFNS